MREFAQQNRKAILSLSGIAAAIESMLAAGIRDIPAIVAGLQLADSVLAECRTEIEHLIAALVALEEVGS